MLGRFSVKKPYTVLVGVVLAVVLGVVSFTRMTTDLLPNISLPYVIVMTSYVGASPETVEMAVTKPVEASMATVSNIEGISSVSRESHYYENESGYASGDDCGRGRYGHDGIRGQ